MENREILQKEVEKLFRAKEKRRRELAKLPFEKKIHILIELQKIANDLTTAHARSKLPAWNIHE